MVQGKLFMKYYLRVLPYLHPFWPLAIFSITTTILMVLASLLEPWSLKILVDNVLGSAPLPSLLAVPLGVLADDRFSLLLFAVLFGLGVKLLQNALTVASKYADTRLEQNMSLDFRTDLFEHAQRLSFSYHDRRQTGALIFAINNQGGAVADVLMTIPPLLQSAFTLIGMFWITFQISHELALLSLTVVPLLYYSVGYYITHIQERLNAVRNLEGKTLSVIHEAMSMLRVIVAFGREDYEHRRFRNLGEEARDKRVGLTVRQSVFSLSVDMTIAAGTALVLGFGAYKSLQGQLTVGQLLVVMSYIAAVYKPLEAISGTVSSLQNQFACLKVAFDLLDVKPEIQDVPNAIVMQHARGNVRFENVHFSYTARQDTLKEISFEARPGQLIGIAGPTGAGKSTLVSLIPRFYEAGQGRILLDEFDIRGLSLRSLRQQISLVLQEPLLFSGTIAENIRYGRLEASMEEIIAAAKAANAHDFIMRLPKQYESEAGERGVQLSGGERQRICVARAFLRDAPILILDEPTSAIDSKTEGVILEALERLMAGRTTFMIAHRLSTLHKADKILMINHGQLVEAGTHDELLRQSVLYKQMYEMQSGRSSRPQPPPSLVLAVELATDNEGDNGKI
jgi:ABC-type multidrug transport system fused ATPase/permease subunit